jgi:hypothetical protein
VKNDFEIRGETVVIFVNCKGKPLETIISKEKLERVNDFNGRWYAWEDRKGNHYVCGAEPTVDGKKGTKIFLHRLIMGDPQGLVIDHENHDGLDNRTENLRIATRAENSQNRRGGYSNTGIRGVRWDKNFKVFKAYLSINKKQKVIGLFETVEEAEKAVKEARAKYMPFSKEARLTK